MLDMLQEIYFPRRAFPLKVGEVRIMRMRGAGTLFLGTVLDYRPYDPGVDTDFPFVCVQMKPVSWVASSAETQRLVRRQVQRRQALLARQFVQAQLRSPERIALFPAIRRMRRRWQQVLECLFGFMLDGTMTLKPVSGRALAKAWGVTPSSIFQIRDKALRQLATIYLEEHHVL